MNSLLSSRRVPHCWGCGGKALAAVVLSIASGLLSSCGQQIASAEQPPASSERSAKTLELKVAPAVTGLTADEAVFDDADLRRGYGAVDMRFADCVSKKDERTFVGGGCASGFVIYGPYVPVPPNCEIEVSFEVRGSKGFEVYSDVVSQMGAQLLAGLNRQGIEAGKHHKLGYRVRIFGADANVESRIGITAEPGAEFEVTNFTMTVR